MAASTQAAIVNFDDVNASAGVVAVPTNYGGISWDSDQFGIWNSTGNGFYPAGSSPNVMLANRLSSGSTTEAMSFSFADSVTFEGMYFATTSTVGNLTYDLLLDGIVKATVNVGAAAGYYASGYAGAVDQVTINGVRGYYVFDNVTYSAGPSAVPEPATWAMFIGGFGLVGGTMRRRLRASVRFA
ncbi:MAG: hypothetical protein DI605_15360 [Sphingomonas sp.]|nr:MAG: hypothetical protein DI605_15360 [Sphingomonas sp.]